LLRAAKERCDAGFELKQARRFIDFAAIERYGKEQAYVKV
jgi:hypothetical protein